VEDPTKKVSGKAKRKDLQVAVVVVSFLAMIFLLSGVKSTDDIEMPAKLYDEKGNVLGMKVNPAQARKQMSPDMLQSYANPVIPVYTGQQNFKMYTGGDEPNPMDPPFGADILVYSSPNTDDTPRIAFNDVDGVLWIVFTHFNGADDDVFLCNSTDVGQTWNPVLWTTGAYNERNPAIAIMGNTIMIAYEQDNAGWEQRTYFIRSQDGGLNWGGFHIDWNWTNGPDHLQLEDFNKPDVSSSRPQWFHWAADVFGVRNNTRTVAFMWTEDDGDNWTMTYWLARWHMNEDFERPVIMENTADGFIHMAFQHWNNTESDWDITWIITDCTGIYSWWTADLDGGNSEIQPDLWVRDDIVYVVWQNGTSADPDLAAFYSDDGGISSIWILWIRSEDGFDQMFPAVYVDDMYKVHVAVVNDTSVMYMNNTDPLGLPFTEYRANDPPGIAATDFRVADVTCVMGTVRMTFADLRSGPADIYYTFLGDICGSIHYTITRFPLSAQGDIIVNGTDHCSGTCHYNWTLGSTHTLEAPMYMTDPVDPNTRYIFNSWSDGGAQTHTITVRASPMTITAIYDTQYNITFETLPDPNLELVIDMVPYNAPQSFWFTVGTVVSVDATSPQTIDATSRWVWQSWSDGGGKSHPITITGVDTYVATFEVEYLVIVTTFPPGLLVEVDAMTYTAPRSFWWLDGSTHDLAAISPQPVSPDEQWAFINWSDGGVLSHPVIVAGPATYTAYYATQFYILFTAIPPGLDVEVDGTVYTTPVGFFFDVGSTHTICAPSPQPINPTSRYIWSSWNDAGAMCHDIVISGPGTYIVSFDVQYRMDVTTLPGGLNVTVDAVEYMSPHSFWCTDGLTAMLGAPSPQAGPTPDQRYRWDSWSDMGVQTHPIICNSPGTYTAFFVTQYQVNVTTDPGGLNIEVEGILYTAPRLEWVDTGGTLLINAPSPQLFVDTRAVYDHWSDGQPQSHVITVTSPGVYIAYFETEFLVTITSTPVTGLDIQVDGVTQTTEYQFWCNDGQMVNLNALSPQSAGPSSRYDWRSWSDGLGQSHTITCTGPDTYTANFVMQYQITVTTNPAGLQVEIDSVTQTAPYTAWWDEASMHTINALSPQDLVAGSSQYDWRTWSDSGAQSHDVTISGPMTYVATFQLQYKITITSDPVGRDVIVEGTTYTAPYEVWWDESTNLDVDVPDPQTIVAGQEQYIFNSWSDSGAKSHSIFVALSATHTAYLDHQYYLTVNSGCGDPQGGGWYNEGATATISVVSPCPPGATDTQYVFNGWAGDWVGLLPTAEIIMDRPKTVIALWATQYYLTVNSRCGDPQGEGWYDSGATVMFSVPTPCAGTTGTRYVFDGWTVDSIATNPSATILMNAPKTVTASWRTQHYLTVTSDYGSPQGAGWYDSDAIVTFSVTTPSPPGATTTRYIFGAWTGDSTATTASAAVTMDAPKTVTATWTTQYYLTVISDRGDSTGSGWYNAGAFAPFSVTTPVGDYEFSGWTGDSTASSSTATITMDAPKTVTATWEEVGFLEKFGWIFPIIIIIIIVTVALLTMRRKGAIEEELPQEEAENPQKEED